MKKRLLSALLTVAMMFSLFPASAFASADQTRGGVDVSAPQTLDTENDLADVTKIVFNPNGPVLNNSFNPRGGLNWDDMGIDPTDYMTTDDRGIPSLSYTDIDSAGNALWTYTCTGFNESLYLISGRFELVNRPRPVNLMHIVVGSYSDPHPAAELMDADLDFNEITLTVNEGCKISGGHYENFHHPAYDGFEILNYGEISGGTFKDCRVDFYGNPDLPTVISGGEFSNTTTTQSFAYHATKITGGTFHHCLVEFDESIEASAGRLPVFDDARIDFCGTAERGAVVKGGLFRGCYFRPSDYGNSVIENGFFLSASGEVYTSNKLQAIKGGLFFNSRINDRYLEEPSNSPYYYVTIEGDVKNRHSYLSVISAKDEYGNPCDPGRYTTYPDIYQYYSGAATAPSIKLATRDFRDAYKNGEPLEIFGKQFTFNDSTAADNITIDADVLLKRIPLLTLPEKVENVTGSDMNGTALQAGESAYVRQRHAVSFTQDPSHRDAVYTANDTLLTPAGGVYSYTMAGPDDVVVKQLNKLAIKADGKPDTDGTFKETGTDGVTTTWYGDGWHYDGTTLTITANQDLSGAKVSVPTEVTGGTTQNGLFEHGLTLSGGNATNSVVFESFTDRTSTAQPKILHVPAGATINEAGCASGTADLLGDPALTVGQPAGTPVGSLWKASSNGAAVSESDLSLPEGSFGNAELAFKMGERSELTLTLTQPPVRSLFVPENCTVYINGIAQPPAESYLVHPGETVKVENPDPTGGPYAWSSEEVTLTPSADTSSCSFVVPAGEGDITIAVTTAPGSPTTPDVTDGAGASVGGSIAVSVLLGGAAYLVGTNIWLTELYGTVPQNRIQLALALWNRADCPTPESTVLYPDIDEDDTDAQAAARWCVEQGLLKDYRKTDADGTETAVFKPYLYTFRAKSIKAWYDLDRLLHETQ